MMFNGRPVGRRKTLQFLMALLVLLWATQVLFSQWARGEELVTPAPARAAAEKFVPGTGRYAAGGTLEIRAEATLVGPEITVKQIARWSEADAAVFAPIADLVLARLDGKAAFRGLTLDEIRSTLSDAGVNLAVIKFAGPTSCTVTRSDMEKSPSQGLEQWAEARQGKEVEATTQPATASTKPEPSAAMARKLRELLIEDLATRLQLSAESLQMTFAPGDEKLLNLSGPHFRFQISPTRALNLGEVAWEVLVVTEESSRKASVKATARAWQQQVVLNRPLSAQQLIQEQDITERRALVDRLSGEQLLSREQVVGQQAALDLKPGTIVTARMIESVPLARSGQLVTVVINAGKVQVKTVARALESGSFGQTIRVRNEATRDVLEVILTGPQTARLGGEAPALSTPNVVSRVE